MIDVHIIIYDEPQWQIDRCLASLKDEPITIHSIQGIEEWPPNQGRALGYSKGINPYVSYVDPDDYIVQGAFTKLLSVIQSGDYDAVHGWEAVIKNGKQISINKSAHHSFVLKRGLSIDYSSSWRVFSNSQNIQKNKIAVINEILYYWDKGKR